jgi:hypothetical protein
MTIELIQTEDSASEKFKYIEEQSYVDPSEEIEYPPVAISMGEYTYKNKKFPIQLGTYGNFSFIQAPPKSKKTFFVSILASAYLGDTTRFTGEVKGHRGDKCLVHFDTEQGRFDAQKVFRRTLDMAGTDNTCYQTFALRPHSYKERLDFIEWYLYENSESTGMVIIDGIADLCVDVNDIKEANELVQRIMRWTEDLGIHIVVVIHSNFGSDKPTGHLGSFLEKKTETQIQLQVDEDNNNLVSVRCKRSRSYPFEEFYFEVNKDGIPEVIDGVTKMLDY